MSTPYNEALGATLIERTKREQIVLVGVTLPGTSEVIPLLQVAPSKTDRERLLVVSPELSEALASIIARTRREAQPPRTDAASAPGVVASAQTSSGTSRARSST